MRLKRLELFGFKSFADKTVLDFEHDLTGIVGPNGCGKSNVVDAVRWVLGETRPTSMRGSGMTDVIFKGSASRSALAIADVTVVLDNSSNSLEGRGPEVSITRRVFQSGEGEYAIDGDRVRLKDLRDMLFDTGLGSRGYSVLEQGRIDAVLSANPVDRRAIFEEAAGISRYRQRRKEAESRLKRVELDLARIDDVLRELSSRVRSLKLQAGKADRFLRVRDEWRTAKLRLVRHQMHAHDQELTERTQELAALEARDQELLAGRERGESEVQQEQRSGAELTDDVDRLNEHVSHLSGELRALDERRAQLADRIRAWEQAGHEEAARAAELEARCADLERQVAEVDQGASDRTEELVGLDTSVRERTGALRDTHQRYRAARADSQRQNQQVLDLLHEKTSAANSLRHLEEARGNLEARRLRAAGRLEDARARVDEVRSDESAAFERVSSASESLDEVEERRRLAGDERTALEGEVERLEQAARRLEVERAGLRSRLESLRDWEREREGLEAGTRAVLECADPELDDETPWNTGDLRGLLADHLTTSTEWARALDAALGQAALGLVVSEPGVARRIAGWLVREEKGQARLLTPAGLAERTALGPPELAPEDEPLVLGRLAHHVTASPGCEPLVELLVGDVLVARDLDAALALVARHSFYRFSTPDGDLVDAGGLVGGHREIAQGAVGRRSSVVELESEQTALESSIAQVEVQRTQARADRERSLARLAGLEAEREERTAALARARGEEHAAQARLRDLDSGLEAIEGEARRIGDEERALLDQLQRMRETQQGAEQRFDEENRRLSELEDQRHRLERERDRVATEENRAEVEATRVRGECEALQQRAHDLRSQSSTTGAELERARRLEREHAENAAAGRQQAEGLDRRHGELAAELDREQTGLGELRAREQESRDILHSSRARVDAVTRELEGVRERIGEQRLEEQRVTLSRSEILRRASEELGLPEGQVMDEFELESELLVASALEALSSRVDALKVDLDKLGPVNTEALDELEGIQGRHDFLESERTDLRAAERTLVETLNTVNRESRRRFTETFEEVRIHFQTLFRQLFGGGKADLALDGEQDPLESGIDISARPPGREMLPIGLLSGGQRTMTALALLFAVFKARPSPFCVLDEVDAALDDANIGRFLAMLDHFLEDTQFIVVTHNKGTMGHCTSLYGITMETRGVSRHVVVEFGEVDTFVPEATGNAAEAQRSHLRTRADAEEEPEPEENEPVVVLEPQPGPVRAPAAASPGRGPVPGEPVAEG